VHCRLGIAPIQGKMSVNCFFTLARHNNLLLDVFFYLANLLSLFGFLIDFETTVTTERNKKIKKRFIAGAVCPVCKSLDTMALTKENGVELVTCVSCGEQMSQPEAQVEKEVRKQEQVIGVFKP
jgi:hypothetical protein